MPYCIYAQLIKCLMVANTWCQHFSSKTISVDAGNLIGYIDFGKYFIFTTHIYMHPNHLYLCQFAFHLWYKVLNTFIRTLFSWLKVPKVNYEKKHNWKLSLSSWEIHLWYLLFDLWSASLSFLAFNITVFFPRRWVNSLSQNLGLIIPDPCLHEQIPTRFSNASFYIFRFDLSKNVFLEIARLYQISDK